MIFEIEPGIANELHGRQGDWLFITAAAYLKGLHHGDKPTSLMPKDAEFLKAARRFYNGLSEHERQVINSFSDDSLFETMNLKHRNATFNRIVYKFMNYLGYPIYVPQEAEKGNNYDSD